MSKLPNAGLNANCRNVQFAGKLLPRDFKRDGKPVNPASGNMFLLGQYSLAPERKGNGAEAFMAAAYMSKLQAAAGRKPIPALSGNNSIPTFLNAWCNQGGWNYFIEHCQSAKGEASFRFWAWPYNAAVPTTVGRKLKSAGKPKAKRSRKPKAQAKGEVVQITAKGEAA